MNRKKLYQCPECPDIFKGAKEYRYHTNAHRRTALPVKKVIAPKRSRAYNDSSGNDSAPT